MPVDTHWPHVAGYLSETAGTVHCFQNVASNLHWITGINKYRNLNFKNMVKIKKLKIK